MKTKIQKQHPEKEVKEVDPILNKSLKGRKVLKKRENYEIQIYDLREAFLPFPGMEPVF